MNLPNFWQTETEATQVLSQIKSLKNILEPWKEAFNKFKELEELSAIIKDENRDKDIVLGLEKELDVLIKKIEDLDFKALFSGQFDKNSAILSIHAGAGGTESCDWAQMLFRMYSRFAEEKGYAVKTLDILLGEEAGIKSITLLAEGAYAYGYLKAERGVHRLVRISPFDANKRRHTSFASVT